MKKIALITCLFLLAASSHAQKDETKKADQKEVKVKADTDKGKVEKKVFQENEKQVKHIDVENRTRQVGSSVDLSGGGNTKDVSERDKGKSLDRIREEAQNETAERKARMMASYSEKIEGGEERVKSILDSKPEEIRTLAPENRLEANKIRANHRLYEIVEQIRIAEARIALAEEKMAKDPDSGTTKVEDYKYKLGMAKNALENLKKEMDGLKKSIQ